MKIDDLRERRDFLLLSQKTQMEKLKKYIECSSDTIQNCIEQMESFQLEEISIKDFLIGHIFDIAKEHHNKAFKMANKLINPIEPNKSFKGNDFVENIDGILRKYVILTCFIQTQNKTKKYMPLLNDYYNSNEINSNEIFTDNNAYLNLDINDRELKDESDSASKCITSNCQTEAAASKIITMVIDLYTGEISDEKLKEPTEKSSHIIKLQTLQDKNKPQISSIRKHFPITQQLNEKSEFHKLFKEHFKFKLDLRRITRMVLIEKVKIILKICANLEILRFEDLLNLSSYNYYKEIGYNDILSTEELIMIDYIFLYQKEIKAIEVDGKSDFTDLFDMHNIPKIYNDISSMIKDTFQTISIEKMPLILNYLFNICPGFLKITDYEIYKETEHYYLLSWADEYKK